MLWYRTLGPVMSWVSFRLVVIQAKSATRMGFFESTSQNVVYLYGL